jgi:type VII secretion protein EccB
VPALNRRDQAQAYAFISRRQSAALMTDEPDSPDSPMRKIAVATFGSVMIAILAVAAAGVYGLLRPGGSTAWRSGQSLILERDTGTRYIYTHGVLHPVLNYASARLILGQATLSIVSVSAASLRGAQRGLPIGIAGAPDELPSSATTISGPWSACSLQGASPSGAATPYVRLTLGQAPAGTPLPASHALLVSALDGTPYLVWNGHRLRLPGGTAALTALGYASASPLPVGDAWLSALPQGPDLAAPALPDPGQAGAAVAGRPALVGQVYATGSGAGAQYFVELRDGLAPVTAVQAGLLLAQPGLRSLYPAGQPAAIPVTAVAAATTRSATSLASTGLPATPPPLVAAAAGQLEACETYAPGGSFLPSVWTVSMPASSATQLPSGTPADTSGQAVADQVQLPAGGGAVVQAIPAPGASGGTLYVVTDEGVKFPLPDASVLTALGLAGATPARLPSALLDLLRTGPTLDPKAAAATVAP